MENQALGLAEAVGRLTPAEISTHRIRWRPVFDWLPVALKAPWMLASASPLPADGEAWPHLWIATGRASLPLSLAARRLSKGRTFVVQTQDPRLDPALFDLVVAPKHDRLSAPNVVPVTGSPHRITQQALADAAPAFAARIDPLPHPRVAVLIGGRSTVYDLTPHHAAVLADQIAATVRAAGGSLMLTMSRRTPEPARAVLTERLRDLPGWIWDGEDPNPLFAFLQAADHVLVTEDSANMAAEAASTGKPVHVLPMIALRPPGKFADLHADLAAQGATRQFDGTLHAWTYTPLAETARAARAILQAMGR